MKHGLFFTNNEKRHRQYQEIKTNLTFKIYVYTRDLRIVFFSFESNLESNRPSDSFSNRIFESNRPYTMQAVFLFYLATISQFLTRTNTKLRRQLLFTLYTYSEYFIHRYFVFVTNESDVRPTELRTEYLFISIQL